MVRVDIEDFNIMALSYEELDESLIQQWAELEERAIESNAYLSPYFILPAVKHLTPQVEPIFIFVKGGPSHDEKLLGVGVFEFSRGTLGMPLPHLKAYTCPHSYLTGLLIDREFVEPTIRAFFHFFCKSKSNWYGIEFNNRYGDTKLAQQFDVIAERFRVSWHEYGGKKRSVLRPKDSGDAYLENILSSISRKSLRRNMRLLREAGQVRWRIIRGQQIGPGDIDNFLKLENMGWKGEGNYSLRSKPNNEAFFCEMIESFARNGRAFFMELSVDDKVIAMVSNLVSGRAGFTFKVGWDTSFAKMSPGILNEIEFIKNAPELFPNLEYIDSGAEEGSYIDKLWVEQRLLISGFYITNILAKPMLLVKRFIRRIIGSVDKWQDGILKIFR